MKCVKCLIMPAHSNCFIKEVAGVIIMILKFSIIILILHIRMKTLRNQVHLPPKPL